MTKRVCIKLEFFYLFSEPNICDSHKVQSSDYDVNFEFRCCNVCYVNLVLQRKNNLISPTLHFTVISN